MGQAQGHFRTEKQLKKAVEGRWVRSPKSDGLEKLAETLGCTVAEVAAEAAEPETQILSGASRTELQVRHLLPSHEGLEMDYTLLVDGKPHPLPPSLARRRFYGRFATSGRTAGTTAAS
jgi:hypothetical protein